MHFEVEQCHSRVAVANSDAFQGPVRTLNERAGQMGPCRVEPSQVLSREDSHASESEPPRQRVSTFTEKHD